jgi:hypothetical protein
MCFKSKNKLIVLRSATLPQIKEAFAGFHCKYKICIAIVIRVCSNISFIDTVFSRIDIYLCFIHFRFNGCVLATIITCDKFVSLRPDISKVFFRFMT